MIPYKHKEEKSGKPMGQNGDRQTDRQKDRQTQKKKAIVPSGYKPVGD